MVSKTLGIVNYIEKIVVKRYKDFVNMPEDVKKRTIAFIYYIKYPELVDKFLNIASNMDYVDIGYVRTMTNSDIIKDIVESIHIKKGEEIHELANCDRCVIIGYVFVNEYIRNNIINFMKVMFK